MHVGAVALRLFNAKLTSTPLERRWSILGNVLTASRRRLSTGRLALLVYARMNMGLVSNDNLLAPDTAVQLGSIFASVFEQVADEERAEEAAAAAARQAIDNALTGSDESGNGVIHRWQSKQADFS